MEKTIFLFNRHKDRTQEDFARYYVNNHAPLGKRLTRCLQGYTVNIVEGGDGLDAVTEHWVAAALDLLTPEKGYASMADFEEVVADDRTLFDGFELYVVTRESFPVPGEKLAAVLGQVTPEAKSIWLYEDEAAAPPPPAGARRVVDNHVGHKLVYQDDGWKAVAPDVQLIRMAWGVDRDRIEPDPKAITVLEYCFIDAPAWGSEAAA